MLNRSHKYEGVSAHDADPLCKDHQPCHSAADADEVKRFATAAAKLALAGFSLHTTQSGSFLVARWSWSTELANVNAVEQLLRRVSP